MQGMIHMLAHISFYVTSCFSGFALLLATYFGAIATHGYLFVSGAVMYTGRRHNDFVVLTREELEINWTVPLVFVGLALTWALVAFGFHLL